jgi:hypothetical protein
MSSGRVAVFLEVTPKQTFASALDWHVRFNVHADHRTCSPGHRQGQLAGSAAQIHAHVLAGQLEGAHEGVDDGAGVSVPVPVVIARCFATEITLHAVTMPSGISAGTQFSPRRDAGTTTEVAAVGE